MRNPYDVLGVSKTADEKAIKSAFRKLAKQYHPDSNKAAHAKERFAEANQAYEIIGDAAKRRQYDAGEIDEQGNEKFAGFGGAGGGFGGFGRGTGADGFETFARGFRGGRSAAGGGGAEDILSQMFGAGGFQGAGGDPFAGMGGGMGGARQQRPAQPAKGADRKISLTVTLKDLAEGKATVRLGERRVALTIPAEAKDGTVVRLKGQGEAGPGGAGDALVTLDVAPHAQFQRFGSDLKTHVAVPFETAVLGGKVRVPTLTGAVALKVPEWTRAGTTMRVRSKGLPRRSGGNGDILVSFAVDLPEERDEALVAAAKARAGEAAQA